MILAISYQSVLILDINPLSQFLHDSMIPPTLLKPNSMIAHHEVLILEVIPTVKSLHDPFTPHPLTICTSPKSLATSTGHTSVTINIPIPKLFPMQMNIYRLSIQMSIEIPATFRKTPEVINILGLSLPNIKTRTEGEDHHLRECLVFPCKGLIID